MKTWSYLLIDLGCILVPFIASFYPKHSFYKDWKYFFVANALVAVLFLIWDYFFTEWGIWGFNPAYLCGIYLANLPIEEILFFVCIPYACAFTYFALNYLVKSNPMDRYHKWISLSLIALLFLSGIVHWDKLYTSFTFLATSGYFTILYLTKINLSYHYLTYLIIFPFFIVSNGLLTGSLLDQPIVWYNNAENLAIRIGTIPVEDTIYGLLLIMMNITIYEKLKSGNRFKSC